MNSGNQIYAAMAERSDRIYRDVLYKNAMRSVRFDFKTQDMPEVGNLIEEGFNAYENDEI